MQFRVLGPVELAGQGRRVSLSSERRRTILAVLLAARGTTVSVDRLVEAVWGVWPPASATKSLRSHVSRLRSELADVVPDGDARLVTDVDGYRLEAATEELDAARFEALVAQARSVVAADPGKAVTLLEDAQRLWRGAAFGELAAHPDVRGEAMALERLRVEAAADLTDAQLALGRHHAAVGQLEARVAAEPLDERAHAQLMVAWYRSGRQAQALSLYRALQERLREELGIDPSPSLQSLHEQVLRQAPELATPQPPPRDRAEHREDRTPREPGRPSPVAGAAELVGRDGDVRSVSSLVTEAALVTLTGPGGVGKTRLAEQVATDVTERFDDGVATAELASVRDPASVGAALIDAVGAHQHGGRPADQALAAALGTRRLLLVLDNCEHLLAAVSQVVDSILRRCQNVAVLATSREPLRLPGERVWQVAPLAVPRAAADAAEIAESPAGALFCARAAEAAPGFALAGDDATAVAELCRRLDGMPLAIELAAARVRTMAPADVLARLSDRFAVLTGGPRHEGGRHRTLQAVVAWSYDLLEEREARLFDRLSVFAGPFSLEAAEAVGAGDDLAAGEVAGLLAELADKSMVTVERTGDARRYRLLDTLRDFGARRLAEAGATESVRRAHADYHLALVEELAPRVRGPDEAAAVAEIDAAVDDLRVAHAWLLAEGDADGALRLPTALHEYLMFRLRDELFGWADRALELPGATDRPDSTTARATAALGALNRGEVARAVGLADSALAAAPPHGPGAMRALLVLGTAALYEGRLDESIGFHDRGAEIAEAHGDAYYRVSADIDRVLAELYRGDTAAALERADALEAGAEACDTPTLRAWAHYCHGEGLLEVDPAEAARRLEAAVKFARGVGSRLPEGAALVSLASLCGRRGDTHRALALFREVIAHWRRLGDRTHQVTTLRNLVERLAAVGADEPAAVLHGAVTAAATPSFGAEADRLAAAWTQLERRLGPAAHTAATRGQDLTVAEAADEALAALDALLEG